MSAFIIPMISLRLSTRFLLHSVLLVLCLTQFTSANDQPSSDETRPWRSLFNGEDLSGWSVVGDRASAVVDKGEIVCHMVKGTKEHTFVRTNEKFSDFILEGDCLLEGDFHTAFLFRCIDADADSFVCLNGYQLKIDPTQRSWTGGVFDDYGKNWFWLHNLADPDNDTQLELKAQRTAARQSFKMNAWNRIRIQAIGNNIRTWVNDVPCVHLVHEKYNDGYIAIKIHSWNGALEREKVLVHYKNIRIIDQDVEKYRFETPLPALFVASNPTPLPGQTPQAGSVLPLHNSLADSP